jgi:RNA polymerase sigma-70 factor, ECF subfamily
MTCARKWNWPVNLHCSGNRNDRHGSKIHDEKHRNSPDRIVFVPGGKLKAGQEYARATKNCRDLRCALCGSRFSPRPPRPFSANSALKAFPERQQSGTHPNLHSPPKNVVIAAVSTDTHAAIDAVWRIESAKVIAGLTRIVRDVGLAEDLAQEALLLALEQWPKAGVPENPGAWLMSTAKHRAIDQLRRGSMLERKHEELGREVAVREMKVPDFAAALDATLDAGAGTRIATEPDTDDDLLRLVFMTCHPVLSTEGRVALTLRLLGGLTTDEIARAFLVSEPTIAQRIVRAKRTLAEKQVPFETPRAAELAARLASVLEVIYLIFNEGYSATAGDDWMRPGLCDDALRLGRILAELMPKEAEVHGLAALMEIQASRARARVGPAGEPVLLLDQNRAHWDQLLIGRGLASLKRAEQLGGARGP